MRPKPEDLYQYGVMGSVYAKHVLGLESPTIGILNVGEEDEKGNELVRAAHAMFRQGPLAAQFVGNIEGRDVYEGKARVLVCEGFTGNVLLKSGEGAVEFLFDELKKSSPGSCPRFLPATVPASPRRSRISRRGSSIMNTAAVNSWASRAPASSVMVPAGRGRSRMRCGSPR